MTCRRGVRGERGPRQDALVDLSLGLERPGDRLAEGLEAAQDAGVARERRQVGRILADEPVQELLEGLAGERPEEDDCGGRRSRGQDVSW